MVSHADLRLAAARSVIADACLKALPDARLGRIQLREDQRRIVSRAERMLEAHGGCLIGEDVGRGKTYIALALARRWRRTLVVAPAALRTTWAQATVRAGLTCAFASHESLSRRRVPEYDYDGIIVDESHHYRTSSTQRYAALALLAARAPVVLLSATALQNRVRDLAAQIALFFGERAFALDAGSLASFVVRGPDDGDDEHMPVVRPPEWLSIGCDDDRVLAAILAMPPPPRALDAGDAGALRAMGLVRAWASSRSALRASLRARSRCAAAIEQAANEGRQPTKRETLAWTGNADGSVQLGFPSLLATGVPSDSDLSALRESLECEREALSSLARVLGCVDNPDAARVEALRSLRRRHAGERIIAFSEYASTVTALFAAMRGDAAVGMLTARGACIASGPVRRDELLGRFAPRAQDVRPHPAHGSVTLLVTTDLLSEGMNLQDASVVVHLDLPWNPARLAQRVGRVRRPDGAREVHSYLLAPPASTTLLLDTEARLRRKLAMAERTIGPGFGVLPTLVPTHDLFEDPRVPAESSASAQGSLFARLAKWQGHAKDSHTGWQSTKCAQGGATSASPVIAAVCGLHSGWLAALDDGRLVAAVGAAPPDSGASVARMCTLAEGAGADPDARAVAAARSGIDAWLMRDELATACGMTLPPGPLALMVARQLRQLQRQLPRHLRASVLPSFTRIRDAVHAPLPIGVERLLAAHAGNLPLNHADIVAWTAAAERVIGLPHRGAGAATLHVPTNVRALIVVMDSAKPATDADAS